MTVVDLSGAASLNEGDYATFTFTLSAPAASPVEIGYATTGSAAGDVDYYPATGTVTIGTGLDTTVLYLPITQDSIDEDSEAFTLSISSYASGYSAGIATAAEVTISDDDDPPTISITDAGGSEGDSLSFTVSLSSESGKTIIVDYANSNGTANSADYDDGFAGTLTFLPGQTSAIVPVATSGDSIDEDDESFNVFLGSLTLSNATSGDMSADGTIYDDDVASISIANAGCISEDGTAYFLVTLTNESTKTVTASYAAVPGSAGTSDYGSGDGVVSFAPGEMTQTIAIVAANDSIDEDDETFDVALSNLHNVAALDLEATATIQDNDAMPSVNISDASEVTEGDSAAFTISLTAESGKAVTIPYSTVAGSAGSGDYVGADTSVIFAPGETEKTVFVTTSDDALDEDSETFSLALGGATNASNGDSSGVGSISDNDSEPNISLAPTASGDEGSPIAFSLELSAPSGRAITVAYSTSHGTAGAADYTATTSTVTIAPENSTWPINIGAKTDSLNELDETFTLTLGAIANASLSSGSEAIGTINGVHPVPLVSDASAEEGRSATFWISLAEPLASDFSIGYSPLPGTADFEDFDGLTATVVITAGATAIAVVVPTVGDELLEGDETFSLSVTAGSQNATGNGLILDDELLIDVSSPTVEEGNSATFTVTLSEEQATDTTIAYETLEGSATDDDYSAATSSIVIASGLTIGHIVVATTEDAAFEGDEAFWLSVESGSESLYVPGTITDDDPEPTRLTLSVSDAAPVLEGDSATFTVTLSDESASNIEVLFGTQDGSAVEGDDYGGVSGVLTFTAGQTTKTVIVEAVDDADDEADESFWLTISAEGMLVSNAIGEAIISASDVPSGRPTVWVTADPLEINESTGSTASIITVSRVGAVGNMTVSFEFEGTAEYSDDFLSSDGQSGDVIIPDGLSSVTLTIQAVDDIEVEDSEIATFLVVEVEDLSGVWAFPESNMPLAAVAIIDDDFDDSNLPPEAVADELATETNIPLIIAESELLQNDFDPDLDDIAFGTVVAAPANGELENNNDGTWTYTPFANFIGVDFFSYNITDGALYGIAVVLLQVKAEAPPLLPTGTIFGSTPYTWIFDQDTGNTHYPVVQRWLPERVGIRRNTDNRDELLGIDDDRLDALVVFDRTVAAINVDYDIVLVRSGALLEVYSESGRLFPAGVNAITIITDPTSDRFKFQFEFTSPSPADMGAAFEVWLHPKVGAPISKLVSTLLVSPFTTLVTLYVGENQSPVDSVGTAQIFAQLYQQGYDVHIYDEDDLQYDSPFTGWDPEYMDTVYDSGWGEPIDDPPGLSLRYIENARILQGYNKFPIIGYSHGGGAAYLLSEQLFARGFSVPFSAYIDAVEKRHIRPELRRPVNSSFHVNLWQHNTIPIVGLPAPVRVIQGGYMRAADINDNVDSDDSWIAINDIIAPQMYHVNIPFLGRQGIAESWIVQSYLLWQFVVRVPRF